jgi:hypothetical protein
MDKESPQVIKLKNGEVLIASIFDYKDGIALIENPIAVVAVPVMHDSAMGETFLLKPWIGISSNQSYGIPLSEILLTCSLRPQLMEQYIKYVESPRPELVSTSEEDLQDHYFEAEVLKSRNLLN